MKRRDKTFQCLLNCNFPLMFRFYWKKIKLQIDTALDKLKHSLDGNFQIPKHVQIPI